MPSVFPALKGKMGDLEYVVCIMHLAEVSHHIKYAEDVQDWEAGLPSELKRQRKLNMPRVKNEMVPYLRDNPDHFYSALAVELERPGETRHFVRLDPTDGNPLMGQLVLDGTEVLTCLDGQHRLKSIELALQEAPELGKEVIAVIVVPHKSIKRSQQLFSDLNRYAKQPSKALNILFEHREFFAKVAKTLADKSRYFGDRTNMETNSLTRKSPHIVTLSVVYECVLALVEDEYSDSSNETDLATATQKLLRIYDEVVLPSLPDLDRVIRGELHPHDVRKKYVYVHSVGQQAIARAVKTAIEQDPSGWPSRVAAAFKKIDWKLNNPEWEGSAVQGGAVANRRQNIDRTATLLKLKMGLEAKDTEKQALLDALKAINPNAELPQQLVPVLA